MPLPRPLIQTPRIIPITLIPTTPPNPRTQRPLILPHSLIPRIQTHTSISLILILESLHLDSVTLESCFLFFVEYTSGSATFEAEEAGERDESYGCGAGDGVDGYFDG